VPDGTRKKLDCKAWSGVFMGYPDKSPGWLVLNPATCRITISVHVQFIETESGFDRNPREDCSIILEAPGIWFHARDL